MGSLFKNLASNALSLSEKMALCISSHSSITSRYAYIYLLLINYCIT